MDIGKLLLLSLGLVLGTCVRYLTLPEVECKGPSFDPSVPVELGEEDSRITSLVEGIQALRTDTGNESTMAEDPGEAHSAPGTTPIDTVHDGVSETIAMLSGLYEQEGQTRLFDRTYGTHVLAPLAVPRQEIAPLREAGDQGALPVESYISAFRRLHAVNSKTPVLDRHLSGFQALGYLTRGSIEVISGGDLGAELLTPGELARMLAEACDRKFGDLPPEQQEFLERLCAGLHVEREKFCRDVWAVIREEVLERAASVSSVESEAVAFLVVRGKLLLASRGLDPDLDRHLDELDALGRSTQRELGELVR